MTDQTRRRQPECAEPAQPGTLAELSARHEQRRRADHYRALLADAQQLQLDQERDTTFDLAEGQGRR